MLTRIDRGLVWTENGLQEISVLVDGERIAGLLAPHQAGAVAVDHLVDAQGLWILPGGVDLHVHISDGAETFFPGSCCAAAGGITTVLDMAPFHACVTPEQFFAKVQQAGRECVTDFGLIAGIVVSEADLACLGELARLGAAYFKVFMPSDPPVEARLLWEAVRVAAHTGLRLGLHAEESGCITSIQDWSDPLAFAHSRPPVAESSATAQVLEMARAAGAPLHICHVSTARTAELIADAKSHGVDVTAEIPAHYLLLNESAFITYGPRVKTTPPLRSSADNTLLWQALADGVLDAIASDHYTENLEPYPPEAHLIEKAAAGIAGLELSLPLLFHTGVKGGRISLRRFVDATATRPAQIAGIASRKGWIGVGLDADLLLVSPSESWTAGPQGDFSRVAASPFYGQTLQGRVCQTWVRGKLVWDGENILAQPGWGRWVSSRSSVHD